jgi:TPR repeat protein
MLFKGVEPNMQESADIRLQGIPEGYATLISSCWLPAQQRPSIQGLQERLSALSRIPIDIAPEDKAGLAPRDLRKLAENYEKTDAKQRALICYERAAQAGDTSAIVRLGFFSLTGQGVERNPLKAEQLFLQASRSDLPDYPHGHPRAQYNLGLMHLKGDGVKLNKGQAYYWLNQAAEQHYEPAEKALRELMAVQPASAKP